MLQGKSKDLTKVRY